MGIPASGGSSKSIVFIVVMLLLVGCGTPPRLMMATPNIYSDPAGENLEDIPDALRTPDVDLLYVTDRQPEKDEAGNLKYGTGRSNSLAFGSVVVDLGHDLTWNELMKVSQTAIRERPMEMSFRSPNEIGRFPPTPYAYAVVDRARIFDADTLAADKKATEELRREIRRRLALTPRKEVFVYVHGYHNTFQDAIAVGGEFWHFLGREGVPIVYTWPAGYRGLFGYTYDRESSEFTVFHLKTLLNKLSDMPEVKAIHLIAHSRGTDVAIAAIRELFIFARGAGVHPLERYKLKNVILAAPDLDTQVVEQRVSAEQLGDGIGQLTLYFSPADKAIGIASKLFQSPRGRVGKLEQTRLSAETKSIIKEAQERASMIQFEGGIADKYGHSYFRTNPAVSSDIVLTLRFGIPPGGPGRPLIKLGDGFWKIPPGYPNPEKQE